MKEPTKGSLAYEMRSRGCTWPEIVVECDFLSNKGAQASVSDYRLRYNLPKPGGIERENPLGKAAYEMRQAGNGWDTIASALGMPTRAQAYSVERHYRQRHGLRHYAPPKGTPKYAIRARREREIAATDASLRETGWLPVVEAAKSCRVNLVPILVKHLIAQGIEIRRAPRVVNNAVGGKSGRDILFAWVRERDLFTYRDVDDIPFEDLSRLNKSLRLHGFSDVHDARRYIASFLEQQGVIVPLYWSPFYSTVTSRAHILVSTILLKLGLKTMEVARIDRCSRETIYGRRKRDGLSEREERIVNAEVARLERRTNKYPVIEREGRSEECQPDMVLSQMQWRLGGWNPAHAGCVQDYVACRLLGFPHKPNQCRCVEGIALVQRMACYRRLVQSVLEDQALYGHVGLLHKDCGLEVAS